MNTFALPDSLVTQLRLFEARLRKTETLVAVAGGAVGLLTTFVLLFVADRFGDTPRWARAALTLTGGALAAWCAHGWARRWLWERRGPAQLAKLLQRHFRTLGDRLQGVIELTELHDLPANISPALLRAAVRQVAEESGRFDFTQAVHQRPSRRWVLAAIVLTVLAAIPFLFASRAATNALARWIAPWAVIERYTFASLEVLPAELVVPHGEAFEIACGLKADSAWKPGTATARLGQREPQQAQVLAGRAVFHLAGQTQPGTLTLRVGDATRAITIRPLHRPEMKELAARVELPAYLGYPAATVPIAGSSAEFLEGSTVQFTGTTSRVLKTAAMENGSAAPAPEKAEKSGLNLLFDTGASGQKLASRALEAEVQGETFATPPAALSALQSEATFRWVDAHGLTPAQPYSVRVRATKDAEPRVELGGLEPETAILPNEVLKLNLASSDDYGLREAWLGWSVRTLGEKGQALGRGEAARTPGAQTKRELTAAAEFSPLWHGIPEDSVVELAAYAVDYLPERTPVESWKHTVYVLSPAKHAERVRERMDGVLKQLDERIRDEERQVEETTAMAEKKPELASERTGEDIKRAEAGERANEAMLGKLTDEMRDVMHDALRNKDIPEGTVADWQQLTEQLDKKAQPPMGEAAQTLAQAGQQPQAREQQLLQAREKQQAALDAMRNAANRMDTANQNLYARNFYNRLRSAAAAEHKVSDGLKGLAKATIGLQPAEIPEAKKQDFSNVATRQDDTTKEVDAIVNDMAGFLKRVPNEKYEAVHAEMKERKVVAELAELASFVRANLGLKSLGRAKQWGTQLDAWATMLQSECKSQGGGEGEMDPDLMELIVSMVRAAQAQDNIREQTQLLEGKREANPQHAGDTQKLAEQQDELRNTVEELRDKTKFNDVKPLLGKVEDLMVEIAGDLRTPRTDEEVLASQGAVIEMLVPPDKKGGKSASMAKMQPALQQMMAKATKSRAAGGNNSRSSSASAGDAAEGAAGKDQANARTVEKAGGASNAGEWPEEFRDQLQAYFQQLDSK